MLTVDTKQLIPRRALKQSGFKLVHCTSQFMGRGQTGLLVL